MSDLDEHGRRIAEAMLAAVLGDMTVERATEVLHSRAGRPWCDAFLLGLAGGVTSDPEISSDLVDGVREALA